MKGKKRILKLTMFFIIGALFGIFIFGFGEWFGKNIYAYIQENENVLKEGLNVFVYGLLIVVALLLASALIVLKRIISLSKQTPIGEEEDRVEVEKYKGMADYSLLLTMAMYMSIIPVSISVISFIEQEQNAILIISVSLFILSVVGILTIVKVGQLMDSYRRYPKITDANLDKKLLNMMDEGERYVTFQGLYVAFQTTNALLVSTIPLMIVFSLIAGQSQIFAIIVVVLVLMISNSRYLLAVRKRH